MANWYTDIDVQRAKYEQAAERSRQVDDERVARFQTRFLAEEKQYPVREKRSGGWLLPALIGGLLGYWLGRPSEE